MRILNKLAILAAITGGCLFGGSIGVDVTSLGVNASGESVFRYSYTLLGYTFGQDQELDFRFNPSVFSSLQNGIAPEGWLVSLFQPNNPPGAFGDFSLLALVNNPPTTGRFSVDVALVKPPVGSGSGLPVQAPLTQPFVVNQFKPMGGDLVLDRVLEIGTAGVPEPASMTLGAIGLIFVAAGLLKQRSR
jgi:hypothetical protein